MLNSTDRIPGADGRLLVVSTDAAASALCQNAGGRCGPPVASANSVDTACRQLDELPISVCIAVNPNGGSGSGDGTLRRLLAHGQRNSAGTQFIVLDELRVSNSYSDARIDAYSLPISETHLESAVRSALLRSRLQQENDGHRNRSNRLISRELLGQSLPIARLRKQLDEAASRGTHVVIRGETGAGLSTSAEVVHALDRRTNAGIIKIDCRITSAESFHRDVLGGERGDAVAFATSCGVSAAGTFVLDHVDSASLSLQDRVVSLLRNTKSDIRVVACANSELRELTQQGHFRDDLYHRICHTVVDVPSLRERRPDIGVLAAHFLARVAIRNGAPPRRLSVGALELLENHDWPGNLVELQGLIEHVCAVERGDELTATQMRPWLSTTTEVKHIDTDGMSLRMMERKLIESTFARFRGNREQTAKQLQIGLRTLSGKLREYGYPPRGGPGSNLRVEQRKAA